MQAFTLVTRPYESTSKALWVFVQVSHSDRALGSRSNHPRQVPKRPTKHVPGFPFRSGTQAMKPCSINVTPLSNSLSLSPLWFTPLQLHFTLDAKAHQRPKTSKCKSEDKEAEVRLRKNLFHERIFLAPRVLTFSEWSQNVTYAVAEVGTNFVFFVTKGLYVESHTDVLLSVRS